MVYFKTEDTAGRYLYGRGVLWINRKQKSNSQLQWNGFDIIENNNGWK